GQGNRYRPDSEDVRTMPLTLDDVRRARQLIAGAAIRTPLVPRNVWGASAEIFLKLENLQPIGSFKIRGATTAMNLMSKAELVEELAVVDHVRSHGGVGGRAIGIAPARRPLNPSVGIYVVEVETGATLAGSWTAGSPQMVEYQPSFVDGIGSKTVFSNMLVM